MSADINGIPYSTAEFDKEGQLLKEPDVPADTAELIVISHGWNNDREAAETLYCRLFENFAQVTAQDAVIKARKMAIVGIIWPSKKFDDFMTEPAEASARVGGGRCGWRPGRQGLIGKSNARGYQPCRAAF